MKYISEFRDESLVTGIIREIRELAVPMNIMEVCGGHTHVICRFGIRELLPPEIRLIHGPGCPVCVMPAESFEHAHALADIEDVVVCCFGDVMRVPTQSGTLLSKARESGSVRMVYSPLDAIKLAQENPEITVVFLAIGFETTAPSTAMAVKRVRNMGLRNFKVLSAHFTVPEALKALVDDPAVRVDGFIAPGHVTTIIGLNAYRFLADDYRRPVAVSGFEPLDLLQSILLILKQQHTGTPVVKNQYSRAVRSEGNTVALQAMNDVFEKTDTRWRGLGIIPGSGLKLNEDYAEYDASKQFDLASVSILPEPPGCRCGDVLKGLISPPECALFSDVCTPDSPIGPCMVSPEGACAAHYRYRSIPGSDLDM
jgi:hydrogenase expression/formation protein HypD